MITDFMGRPIAAGCVIVYPVRRGSVMELKELKITQVQAHRLTGFNKMGRTIHIQNIKDCVVVEPRCQPTT